MDERAEPGVVEREGEGEVAMVAIDMADAEPPRR